MRRNNVFYLAQKKENYYLKYKSRRKLKGRKRFLFFIILIVLCISFTAIYYLFNNQLVVVLARYDEVVDGFETEGLLVRDELIHYSPVSGFVKLRQNEGERVSYGQEIISIDNTTLYNYQAGIVSYAVDNLEEILLPEILDKITVQDFNRYKRDFKQLVNGKYLTKGEPVFRIIKPEKLYLIVKAPAEEVKRYRLKERVFVRSLKLDKGLIDGEIIGTRLDGSEGLLIVSLNIFIPEWLNIRRVEIEFIKNIYRGIIIPKAAVFTQPEGQGVLLYSSNGSYTFKKIKVLEEAGEKVVVEGIEVGDSVIANPQVVGYGRGV